MVHHGHGMALHAALTSLCELVCFFSARAAPGLVTRFAVAFATRGSGSGSGSTVTTLCVSVPASVSVSESWSSGMVLTV